MKTSLERAVLAGWTWPPTPSLGRHPLTSSCHTLNYASDPLQLSSTCNHQTLDPAPGLLDSGMILMAAAAPVVPDLHGASHCPRPRYIPPGCLGLACPALPPCWLLAGLPAPTAPPTASAPQKGYLHSGLPSCYSPCRLVAKAFNQKICMVSDSKMAFLVKTTGLQLMTQKIRADKGTDLAPCQHVLKSQLCPWALQPSLQGHRILDDRAGSFLLKQRTQTLLSEVARCPGPFPTDFSPAGFANTCQWGEGLVPDPTARKRSSWGWGWGSQIPCESHQNILPPAAFLGSSGIPSSVPPSYPGLWE